ncbi:MAG: methyltransferase domain-containing protein [Thermoanaerobaculia bacterium]
MLTPRRIAVHEHLDHESELTPDVLRSLDDLRGINRWLGGTLAYRSLVERVSTRRDLTVADLGSGTADLLRSLPATHRRIGLDLKLGHHAVARAKGEQVALVAADAFRIPLLDRSVDLVTSSHFFHHFDPDENRRILDESLRVSRLAVALTDTRRHCLPLAFVSAVAATPLWSPITRFDAPASVRQGYTLEEVRDIAARTHARRFEVFRMLSFRFGLILWK